MIRNSTAIRIASSWHGGGWSALYQYASSGTYIIQNHLRYLQEIETALHPEYNLRPGELNKQQEKELEGLKAYFLAEGEKQGIKTVYEKHPDYGYLIPYVAEDTPEDITNKITAIKYMK